MPCDTGSTRNRALPQPDPLYPKTAIRIRKGSANGIELTGLKLDEDKQRVMEIMQQVWEDDSWLH